MARRSLHGYIFKPTDKELMQYLEGFVLGKPLKHTSDFIALEDLYGEKEPAEIFGSGDPMTRYYFTQLRRKCQRGSRFLRRVGDRGTWKGQDAGHPIRVRDKVMGFRKSLKYETKKSKSKDGLGDHPREDWLMKEYSLSNDYLRDKNVVLKDVVLCRIRRVVRSTSGSSESSTLNINENDTPLEIYNWPENDVVSLPPSETSTLAPIAAEVSSGVDDANGGVIAMDNHTLQVDEFNELDELLRRLENDDVTVSLPPSETSTLAAAQVSSGVDDAYGGVIAMENDRLQLDEWDQLLRTPENESLPPSQTSTLAAAEFSSGVDELDELLKKIPPHDVLEDYNFWNFKA
ncbi:NAC domain-containing protein 78-like [Ipomoea triloba]|uniref:NAC domain-containing protein 78-like n=1 Tax=Ipomoea triloba TaxID=35885 RepID=UPI00125D9360|nr:NAC domain-containing protein 78-like [Ipomoea triloba]